MVVRPTQRLGAHRGLWFEPYKLQNFANQMTNTWVPCGSPRLGHVAPSHSAKTNAKCQTLTGPTLLCVCHIIFLISSTFTLIVYHMSSYGHAMSFIMDMPSVTLIVVTCVTLRLGHLSIHVSVYMPSQPSMCHLQKMPTMPTTLVVQPVQSAATWNYTVCTLIIFLHVWKNEYITIT
jgi:hypothetical protein